MDEALIKRVPPHSIEAEQSVVGAMLMDRDAITVAAEIICGDDFYQKAYGVIFDSVVELFNEGKPVDLITLQNRLREKAVPEEISSLEFVRDLVTAVPTSANVKYYAEIVSEKATLRRLIKMNEAIADECYQGQEPLEAILGMYQAILPSADSLIKCLILFNLPFTLVKGLLDSVLCMLIYKPLSPILHGRR